MQEKAHVVHETEPARRGFHFSTGDLNWLDYGGVWARHVDGKRFHFIELTNMDEACGRDNEGHERYAVELCEVDLLSVPDSIVVSAMDARGWDRRNAMEATAEQTAEMIRSYGTRAPLHSISTNNARRGIAECRRESYALTRDAARYEAAMERPVNRIGTTARENAQGDLNSALLRGIAGNDPAARIIGKMYVATNGQTLGGRIPEGELEAIREGLEG